LCAIIQFEEARFFIESEFWRCDFLTYCRGHHRIGRIEQATMTTARGTELGYTLSVPMIGPLLLLPVNFSRVSGFHRSGNKSSDKALSIYTTQESCEVVPSDVWKISIHCIKKDKRLSLEVTSKEREKSYTSGKKINATFIAS
jgi:hypothetical protein